MKKIILKAKDILDWCDITWDMYASQYYRDALLRFWTRGPHMYKVTHGSEVLYEGSQLAYAIAAWEAA